MRTDENDSKNSDNKSTNLTTIVDHVITSDNLLPNSISSEANLMNKMSNSVQFDNNDSFVAIVAGNDTETVSSNNEGNTDSIVSGTNNTATKNDYKESIIGMDDNSKTSNLFLTMINLCNMIIGSGVIVLANALSQSGILLGIILLAISSSLADFSIMALAKSGALTDKFTYQSVVNKALGKPGVVVITVCQIIYPIFAVVSYSVAIRDNLRDIVLYFFKIEASSISSLPWYLDDRFLLALITIFIILPLASMRNISKLDRASFCSVLLVFVYVGCVMYNVFVIPKKMFYPKNFISYGRIGFINSINVYAFALSCQHNVLPMFRSMRGMSVKKFGEATHGALVVTTILYIIVALAGYLTFAGDASGNLLKDYCSADVVILLARFAFTSSVVLTSPLQIYSSREAISTLIYKVVSYHWMIHFILTISLITLCYFFAIFVSEIENVISLSGSLVAAPVVFMLPAASLLLLMKQGLRINNYTKFGCAITFLFGCLILIVGTIISIKSFINSPPYPIKYWCDECYISYPEHVILSLESNVSLIKNLWKNV